MQIMGIKISETVFAIDKLITLAKSVLKIFQHRQNIYINKVKQQNDVC